MVAEDARGVGADFHFLVQKKSFEVGQKFGVLLCKLADPPESVDAAEEWVFSCEGFLEDGERFHATLGEGVLRAAADPLVGVIEKGLELFGVNIWEALREEFSDLLHGGSVILSVARHGVDVSFVRSAPSSAVVGDVKLAVVAPIDVGESDALKEDLLSFEFEFRTIWFEGKVFDDAAVGIGDVADDEEVFVELARHGSYARVVGQAARTVDGVCDGWIDEGRLAVVTGFPNTFVHPGVDLIFFARWL